MNQPPNSKQNVSTDKTKIILVIIILAILLLALGILVGLVLRQSGFQLPAPAIQTQAIPTIFFPTPDCGAPTLVIGVTTFQIQTLTPPSDGSLAVPPDTSGIAYWVEGTDSNYVFVLSPTPGNIALVSTLTAGSTAKATWTNCNSTTYNLATFEQSPVNISTLLDQSASGITVLLQSDPATASFVVKGELTEEQISTINTPAGSEIQAEISLLETKASPDGTTIRVGISIQNYGEAAFTLSASDVSLTQQDSTPLVMVSSEPPLPKEITPGTTETIYLTFPRPSSQTATIKIFNIEYDLEGY